MTAFLTAEVAAFLVVAAFLAVGVFFFADYAVVVLARTAVDRFAAGFGALLATAAGSSATSVVAFLARVSGRRAVLASPLA